MPPSLGRVWNSCKTETFPPAAKKTGTGPICTLTRKPELCGVGQVFAETASTADAIKRYSGRLSALRKIPEVKIPRTTICLAQLFLAYGNGPNRK